MSGPELRRAVLRQLDRLDSATATGADEVLLPVARGELDRLVSGWLDLLDQHAPGDDGRCAHCRGLLRRTSWPCAVWRAAHAQLIGPHPDPGAAAATGSPASDDSDDAPDPWIPPETGPPARSGSERARGVDWAAVAARVSRKRRRG
ncbi:hypothetical protein IQ251_15260 [Saccharopolyspora sp. HNM0983]|uniref:Uncharacterized protein n=1 Tax=Saccharopolyspora montiporae TaxID=2781240 RepID=A0A929BD11_9PSEU|nr:hypothetical protein [Saccharopolyspora sp. HNM0983]MBE9375808.1 hypothetical protein [Saccharopolyspora sp. HNM0983]